MKIKTNELTRLALNWAVAVCEGREDPIYRFAPDPEDKEFDPDEDYSKYFYISGPDRQGPYNPSTDWLQGGPIIEREGIGLDQYADYPRWQAFTPAPERPSGQAVCNGPTPLIAAMRCYVASKLGDTVEIPTELGESK
jgi:hypothetical protein